MTAKKKPATRNRKKSPRTRSTARKPQTDSFKRFLRAFAASAVAAFGIVSCVLNPQWLDELAPFFAQLGWPGQEQTAPRAVVTQGYVQTRFAQCPHFFPARQPPLVPAASALRELCFTAFAVLHSGHTKTPVLVAERLNRSLLEHARGVQRTDRFYAEARLPMAERAELEDYRGSGYSRGHMAPAGNMATPEAMAQSFSLANMVPQDQTHNAGAWSRIEEDTRRYIRRAQGDVYVFTGPVYEPGARTIGTSRVAVPGHLFKLVYDPGTGRAWAHWQANRSDARAGPPISYDEFVRRTGLQLLPKGAG